MNLKHLEPQALLALYAEVLGELRTRGITRSTNNPVADYAEMLVATSLSLNLTSKSTKGHDAVGADECHYEIKARRVTEHNGSRQLSALRKLDERHFAFLAGVLFRENFTVWKGCLIPHEVVIKKSTYRAHTNAWIFHLTDDIWSIDGVVDISAQLVTAESEIGSRAFPQGSDCTSANTAPSYSRKP